MKLRNLTHVSQIQKLSPESKLPGHITAAQKSLDDYEQALKQDQTKTKTERALLLNQAGAKQSEALIKLVQSSTGPITDRLKAYDARVDEMMRQRNVMDSSILAQTAAGLMAADFSPSKIYKLAQQDPDVARAVLLNPTLKFKLELDSKMKAAYQELVREHTLGEDYQPFLKERATLQAIDNTGTGMVEAFAGFTAEAKTIEARQAKAPDVQTGAE